MGRRTALQRGISWLWVLASVALLGCVAPVGTSKGIEVPSNAKATCERHCASIGLPLDSVVIMADNVGCVCRERTENDDSDDARADSQAATSAAAGAIAQMIEERKRVAAAAAASTAVTVTPHLF